MLRIVTSILCTFFFSLLCSADLGAVPGTVFSLSADAEGMVRVQSDEGATDDGQKEDAPEEDGKADDGKADDGKADDGKADDGKADDGKADDGKADDGKADDGKADDGKADDGKADDGKAGDGKADDGKAGDGKAGDGKAGDGKAGDGKADDGKADDGKADDGKADDGKADDGKAGDGKAGDGKADDGKADDGKADDGKADDGKADDGKADDGKADDGNADDGKADGAETGSVEYYDAKFGDDETGGKKTGGKKTGGEKTGDEKTGDEKTGDEKTGDEKTGDEKTGDEKTGDEKTGDEKTGDEKTGDEKTGDEKTGDGGSGDGKSEDAETADSEAAGSETADRAADAQDVGGQGHKGADPGSEAEAGSPSAEDEAELEKMMSETTPAQKQLTAASSEEASSPDPMSSQREHKRVAVLVAGEKLWKRYCASCHGDDAVGGGAATAWTDISPPDLSSGEFRWRSTPLGTLPTDADLSGVIDRGVSQSAMPAFGHRLSDVQRAAVLVYLKSLVPRFAEEGAGEALVLPTALGSDENAQARGQRLFENLKCAQCHGEDGSMVADGSYDIRHFPFRSGNKVEDLYQTISVGAGNMPSFAVLSQEERWALALYFQSLHVGSPWWGALLKDAKR